jgi:hypothetical protein
VLSCLSLRWVAHIASPLLPADPSIKLYQDGKLLTSYSQSRDAKVVQAFITVHSIEYSKRRPDGGQSANGELHLGSGGDGTVVKLDRAGLDRVKKEGGFVKYFAPWCVGRLLLPQRARTISLTRARSSLVRDAPGVDSKCGRLL